MSGNQRKRRRPSIERLLTLPMIIVLAIASAVPLGCGKAEPSVEQRLLQRQRERQVAELAKPQSFDDKLKAAEKEFERGNFLSVRQATTKLLTERPDEYRVLILSARAVAQMGDKATAVEMLTSIPDDVPTHGAVALRQAATWLADEGNDGKAIDRLQRLRESDNATHRDLHELATLLNNSGRRLEAAKVLAVLLRASDITEKELFSLITLGSPFIDETRAKPSVGARLDESALAVARVQREKDANQALRLAIRLHETYPQSRQIFAFLIRVSAELQDWKRVLALLEDRPNGMEDEPEYWFALGLLFQHRGEQTVAARSFLESIALDPTDRFSCLQLARSFLVLEETDLSLQMMQRYQLLDETSGLIRKIGSQPGTDDQLNRLADLLDALHRPLEAIEWRLIAAQQRGEIGRELAALKKQREDVLANVDPSERNEDLAMYRIDDWPLPNLETLAALETLAGDDADSLSPKSNSRSPIEMQDVADDVGLKFQFINRHPRSDAPFLIFHLSGGGIGVLDFDLDGWPDCYFTQAGGPPRVADASLPNQLFRNVEGQRFESVSELTFTADRGFGQGVAVADLNQDGFPDLLVANIGRSVWFQNQGDGTFVRRALTNGSDLDSWTTSIACGDLSGDGLPEIVLVNYSDDEGVYQLPCQVGGDYCSPLRFRAAHDRILTVNADGTLFDWQNGMPSQRTPGHGFGAIIGNIDGQPGNELLIVNDTDSNHYWMPDSATDANGENDQRKIDSGVMSENAQLFGLATGILGNRQGCMGLAHGDFDRNGRMDFHVTNYWDQPSDLYLQQPGSFFQNATMGQGVGTTSVKTVGWGTQATDLDRDGWLDLAALNGHVVDQQELGTPFKMAPQLFRGGPGGFQSVERNAGSYWLRPTLGRSLATIDWNRDGKMDLLATHLDDPVAMLENRTSVQNWIQFDLVGVTSARDAVGAEIRIEAGGHTWTGWMVGGHGFQCSNESIVDFGIGAADSVTMVEIRWPSGRTQRFANLDRNQRYLVFENQTTPFVMTE